MSNPALGAETGDTLTTGFVWQPDFASWIDGLQVSVDWYDIDLSNAIVPYGAQRIVDDCFATGAAAGCAAAIATGTAAMAVKVTNRFQRAFVTVRNPSLDASGTSAASSPS